jgi:hypothetical protein
MASVVLCVTIVEKHTCSQSQYSRTLVKNKIVNVSTKEVWDDVEGAAFGDADQEDCVNDDFEHGAVTVTLQLHTNV